MPPGPASTERAWFCAIPLLAGATVLFVCVGLIGLATQGTPALTITRADLVAPNSSDALALHDISARLLFGITTAIAVCVQLALVGLCFYSLARIFRHRPKARRLVIFVPTAAGIALATMGADSTEGLDLTAVYLTTILQEHSGVGTLNLWLFLKYLATISFPISTVTLIAFIWPIPHSADAPSRRDQLRERYRLLHFFVYTCGLALAAAILQAYVRDRWLVIYLTDEQLVAAVEGYASTAAIVGGTFFMLLNLAGQGSTVLLLRRQLRTSYGTASTISQPNESESQNSEPELALYRELPAVLAMLAPLAVALTEQLAAFF